MKNKIKYVAFSFLVLFSFLLYIFVLYQISYKDAIDNIEQSLVDAIENDYKLRLSKTQLGNIRSRAFSLRNKFKNIEITSEEGIEIITFEDSIDIDVLNKITNQYILTKLNPLHVETFDSIFAHELQKRNITARSGIMCTYKSNISYSEKDSSFYTKAYSTPIHVLDAKKELTVKGFVCDDFVMVFKAMDNVYFASIFVFFFIGVGVVCIFYLYQRKKEEKLNPSIEKRIIEFGSIKIVGHKLFLGGVEKEIKNIEFRLLLLFFKTPDKELTREEIIRAFWSEKEDCNDRVNTIINRLRVALKDAKDVQIERIPKVGYKLIECPLHKMLMQN